MMLLPSKAERLNQGRASICGALLLCFLLTACSTPQLQQQHPSNLPQAISVSIPLAAKPQETIQFNDYTITRYFIEEQNPVLEIKKADVTVFTLQESSVSLGSYGFPDEAKFPIGKNLTGNGRPNLVVILIRFQDETNSRRVSAWQDHAGWIFSS